jgi:hypothetical protein
MNITSRVPQKPLEINGMVRTVIATNDDNYLKIYLEFSEPVLNSTQEILPLLHTSSGMLAPTSRSQTLGNRRFGYIVSLFLESLHISFSECISMLIPIPDVVLHWSNNELLTVHYVDNTKGENLFSHPTFRIPYLHPMLDINKF